LEWKSNFRRYKKANDLYIERFANQTEKLSYVHNIDQEQTLKIINRILKRKERKKKYGIFLGSL
jgi:hypothetical protein